MTLKSYVTAVQTIGHLQLLLAQKCANLHLYNNYCMGFDVVGCVYAQDTLLIFMQQPCHCLQVFN